MNGVLLPTTVNVSYTLDLSGGDLSHNGLRPANERYENFEGPITLNTRLFTHDSNNDLISAVSRAVPGDLTFTFQLTHDLQFATGGPNDGIRVVEVAMDNVNAFNSNLAEVVDGNVLISGYDAEGRVTPAERYIYGMQMLCLSLMKHTNMNAQFAL